MVFVHGGGFVAGSTRAPLYDGSSFARDGVVMVTVNYRLGVVGFLDLPGAPANRGLLDIVAALRWVQANIGAFGGDPGNVTVVGQSAGATLVSAALVRPDVSGLVRRAIVQSGNGCGAFSPEQAARVTDAAAKALGVPPQADAFAAVSDARLVDMVPSLAGLDLSTPTSRDPLQGISQFSVVLDEQPADSVASGSAGTVDLLVGSNLEEGNLYLAPDGRLDTSTAADVAAAASMAHPRPDALLATHRARRPGASDGELRSAILGDALFGRGTRELAQAHAEHAAARTFVYEFAWRSGALDGALGAAHTVELPFVFDVTHLPALRGPNGLLGPDAPPPDLASRMHGAWVAFAGTGDPGWTPYDTGTRTIMRMARQWEPVEEAAR